MDTLKKYFVTVALLVATISAFAQYERRSDPNDYKQPVLKAIAYGITAPSAHNTQAWLVDTISSTEMLLYVKHLVPETDPPARQIHMSAGAFIELVAIGMSFEGFKTEVVYFPYGKYDLKPDELAEKPVAKIKLIKDTNVKKDILHDYIYERETNRKPYKGKMITQDEFNNIKYLMGEHFSEIIFITGKEDMKPYLDIFSRAFEIETRTKATNEETRQLFRFNEQQRAETRDGISIPAMGYSGMIARIAEKSLKDGDSLTWHSDKNFKATMRGINKGIYSSKGIIMFKTNTNTPLDWVKSGRDYARFNIAIAKMGIATHPYNQVIQEYPEMEELQQEFAKLTRIYEPEKIQMITRVGRAKSTYKSWRKNIEDYIMKHP